jgi:hypothetical protein
MWPLEKVLDRISQEDLSVDSPIGHSNLAEDLELPMPLRSERLANSISSVNLLMSSGNVSSVVHQDGYDNFLTVLYGQKQVILWHPELGDKLAADNFIVAPGLLPFDALDVDLNQYVAWTSSWIQDDRGISVD